MAICVLCGTNFEAVRSTAKYCSDACKLKANRGTSQENAKEETIQEKIAEEVKTDCCKECVTFESGIHWCPNKECGCWETREEQEASLLEFEKNCPHTILISGRCSRCFAFVFTPNQEIDWEEEKKKRQGKKN